MPTPAPGSAIGFDVGGTKILGVVTGANGEQLASRRVATPTGAAGVADALADLICEFAAESPIDAVGIGMAGLIGLDGTIVVSPNVQGVAGINIGREVAARLAHRGLGRVHIAVENEVHCSARWELACGALRDVSEGVVVALGTGVGGAFVTGGRVVRGVGGLAGEPGHMIVAADGAQCRCGRRGCWEVYASGSGLERLARRVLGDDTLVGPQVTAAARVRDPDSVAVLDEFARWVAVGLSNLVILHDPEVVVIGGGLSRDWDLLRTPIDRHLSGLLIGRNAQSAPRIVRSQAGESAAALGAAMLSALPEETG